MLAMMMMIQGHTIYALASPESYDISIFPWNIWHFLRGITAPVFLMISGAVHVFANKRNDDGTISPITTKKRIKIAIILIFVGYLLVFPAQKIWDIFFLDPTEWYNFYKVNILQLFGVSLIIYLLIFVFTRNHKQVGIISLILSMFFIFMTPVIHNSDWTFLPRFLSAYLSHEPGSLFPLFPFSAYLFMGGAFGAILKGIKIENRLKKILIWGIPTGIVFLAIGVGFEYFLLPKYWQIKGFYHVGLTFTRMAMVFFGLPIVVLIYIYTKKLEKYYIIFGRRALFIYVAHLVLIYGCALFPGVGRGFPKEFSIEMAIGFAVIIEIISLYVAYFYETSIKNWVHARRFYKILIAAYLIILFFI